MSFRTYQKLLIAVVFLLTSMGCSMKKTSNEKIEALGFPENTKIFFGHQSVGNNILEGITILTNEILPIVSMDDANFPEMGIVHKQIGRNEYPLEKIEDFRRTLLEWPKESEPDIALMKLCFIDFTSETDLQSVFSSYTEAIHEIENQKPNIKILHITVPLTTSDPKWKALAKKILGRSLWGLEDNLVREQYNELMRSAYENSDCLFDLAKYEAIDKEGTFATFRYNGEKGIKLRKEYTSDGGHLNENGRVIIARKFLEFLAKH